MLELDGAAGGHHRGRQQRRDVRGSGAHRADPDDRRSGSRSRSRARGERAAGGAASGSADAEHVGEHAERPKRRDDRAEPAAHAAQLVAELPAAGAVPHVAASRSVRTQPAVVGEDQLLADVGACGVAGFERLAERQPRAHEQRLHRRHRDPERARHVGVGHSAELAHQECRPLLLGEPAHVRDQAPERLAPVGLVDRVVNRRAQELQHLGRRWGRPAQLVDAAVVGDAVEPGPERELAVVGPQARIRAYEDVLKCVLRVLAVGEHLPRVGEQPLPVAVVDHPEGVVVTRPEQRYELLIRSETKKWRPDRCPRPGNCSRCWEGGSFHVNPHSL